MTSTEVYGGQGRKRVVKGLAVPTLVAMLVAAAVFGGYSMLVHPAQGSPPTIHVTSAASSGHSYSNTTVQIFSWVPSAVSQVQPVDLRGFDPTLNPYEVELFQGLTDASGGVTGTLSTEFSVVDAAWLRIITPLTGQVSLLVFASHTEVVNGSLYEYSYFNNIPYNPRSPPSQFSIQVAFDWSHPSTVLPLATLSPQDLHVATLGAQDLHVECIPKPGGGCYPTCPPTSEWVVVNQTSPVGPMPIAMGNLSYLRSTSALTYGASYASSSMNLAFTSNDAQQGATYVGMSTQPSYNTTDSQGVFDQDQAFSNDTMPWGLIYLNNVTYHSVNSELYVDGGTYPNCHYIAQNVYRNDLSVANVLSNSFVFKAEPIKPAFGQLLYKMFKFNLLTKTYEAPGAPSVVEYNVLTQATGYTNAQDALHSINNAASYFDSALGLGLAMAAAAGWIPLGGEAADVATAVGLISAWLGFETSLISLMATISFSVTEHTSIEMVDYAVYGSSGSNGLYLNFYQATGQSALTTGSGTYPVNMPPTYVVATQS